MTKTSRTICRSAWKNCCANNGRSRAAARKTRTIVSLTCETGEARLSNLGRAVINFIIFYLLVAVGVSVLGFSNSSIGSVTLFTAGMMTWFYMQRNPGRIVFDQEGRIAAFFRLSPPARKSRPQVARRAEPPAVARTPREVAERALRGAGLNPAEVPIQLEDIGLLVYEGGVRPTLIARDEPIPVEATHIRPFLRLDFPHKQVGGDNLRFELLNNSNHVQFSDEAWYDLKPGENFLVTKTWLPLHSQTPDGRWQLRVTVGETRLAVHNFHWERNRFGTMRARLSSDGEIDPRNRPDVVADKPLDMPMSLDELLSDQGAAQSTARRQ